MDQLDKLMVHILGSIEELKKDGKNPRYIIMHQELFDEIMVDFKSSLAFSELEYSFLSKVEELEKEIGRFDLKISVGKLYDLHIILSDIIEPEYYFIF
jgi:hypothetical protein